MIGKVHEWKMTPEQLAEYVAKHPIKPSDPRKVKNKDFADQHEYNDRRRKKEMKGEEK